MLEIRTLTAVIGLTLAAVSLTGSTEKPATLSTSLPYELSAPEIRRANDAGRAQFAAGHYLEARAAFLGAAGLAQRAGDPRSAAMNWNNAGGSALARLDYRDALADLLRARQIAEAYRKFVPLAMTMNNLASLYLEMGNPAAAIQIAREGLLTPAGRDDPTIRPKLRIQLAGALSKTNRFDEADGIYRAAVDELEDQGDFESTARILANWGAAALDANRPSQAEAALTRALFLVRIHGLPASANILLGLAKVRSRQGDNRSAAALFQAALDAPQNLTPRWTLFADRAQFRLDSGQFRRALEDFREANRLALLMRADIVPADRDRIALEGGLSRIEAGLVEAGNRLARETGDRTLLRETFDASEQDRLWSLRLLLPAAGDWRAHLPQSYWDLLARYQSTERSLLAQPSPSLRQEASALELGLQQIEADASPGQPIDRAPPAFDHVRQVLDAGSVLFSFHLTHKGGWLWATDREGIDVYPIPGADSLGARIQDFAAAVRQGDARATAMGAALYGDLFGALPARYRGHERWLLELDGPLFDLPFAALPVGNGKYEPIFLIERAALEIIPGALMLEPHTAFADARRGEFLGIGDAVYNAADARYNGAKPRSQAIALPRLLQTSAELKACSRAWGSADSRILTGEAAQMASVRAALAGHASVIHFATHIVKAPGDRSTGLIALSLDRSGAMGLLGPTEIAAHPVHARLVVLNGCHSAEGDELPGSGLMGLTRAWIGAGAEAVLATSWDIPDEDGKTVMVRFYRALRAHPERGPADALRRAQMEVLASSLARHARGMARIWAAYFLLGRG